MRKEPDRKNKNIFAFRWIAETKQSSVATQDMEFYVFVDFANKIMQIM